MEGSAKPQSYRLRLGRSSESGRIYLVTSTCEQRRPLFLNQVLGRHVVHAFRDTGNFCDTLAFVIMPDHFHWLLELKDGAPLSRCVQKAKARSTQRIRAQLPNVERVWQRGFHDRALRKEDDIQAAARYIIANPLRAGIVRSVREYPLWDAVWV